MTAFAVNGARRSAAAALGFTAVAAGLAVVLGLALLLTQPTFGFRSVAVFGPLALLGIAVAAALARWASPSNERSYTRSPSAAVPVAKPKGQVSVSDGSHDDMGNLAALRHEFRTPLNAVLGFSDVLLSGIDGRINDSQKEDLEIIRASGMKLQVLLDSALDLSQLASGTLKPNADLTDAMELVERAAREAVQLWAGKREVRVTSSTAAFEVVVDGSRLRRCILVLADLLATHHRDAVIEVGTSRTDALLVISLSANPSTSLALEALPTPEEVIGAEDPMKIRRWPVAVSAELVSRMGGSLYHGDDPARFVIRLPIGHST